MTAPTLSEAVEALLAGPHPLPIVQTGNPVLRTVSRPYDGELSAELFAALLDAMRETMYDAPGVGLAAPQVGLGIAVAVLEDPATVAPEIAALRERTPLPFRVLVNPRYEAVGDCTATFHEGCLSVSGFQGVVTRPATIRLTGHDEHGTALDEELTGWPARIVQHETDHLNGVLYLDRADLRTFSTIDNHLRFGT